MNQIEKFLNKLRSADATKLKWLLQRIQKLELNGLDIKKLKGQNNFFRIRKGKFRIIFTKNNNAGIITKIDYRNNIY